MGLDGARKQWWTCSKATHAWLGWLLILSPWARTEIVFLFVCLNVLKFKLCAYVLEDKEEGDLGTNFSIAGRAGARNILSLSFKAPLLQNESKKTLPLVTNKIMKVQSLVKLHYSIIISY